MATDPATRLPRSVVNLHMQAQISHHVATGPDELLLALQRPDTAGRRATAAQAVQEAEIPDLADLLVDRVVTGRELHALITTLAHDGAIRRPDLTEWSERFS